MTESASSTRVAAVDMGATSIRVATIDLEAPIAEPTVVHRWGHGPVEAADGSLRWDWDGIVAAVRRGLDQAIDAGPLASIGIDAWGLDYGLLDRQGRLLSPPYSYRDPRTTNWQRTADQIGRERLYTISGVQLMAVNTIFQLAVHDRRELERGHRMLMIPDLLVHELCGYLGAELSIASTTALLDVREQQWSPALLDAIGVDPALLPELRSAGHDVGAYRGVPIHLVGGHDTASAVAALPPGAGSNVAFVSSGTWFLVGTNRPEADTSAAAQAANFSNELGALGGVRFLKNVMGLWMLEQCRPGWGNPPMPELVARAQATTDRVPLVDATDERFLTPGDMEREVRDAAGLGADADSATVARCILESIAATTAEVIHEIGDVTGEPIDGIVVVGGGARIAFLNRLIADRAGVPVTAGSSESTALGNALVQGVALGRFRDLADARTSLALTTG